MPATGSGMKRIILVIVLLVALAAAAALYFLRSRPAPAAASLLADSTLLFMETPDFRRAQVDFQKTALYELWKEPEVQAFLEEPRRALGEWLGDAGLTAEQNNARDMIVGAFQGEVFAAVTRVSLFPSPQVGIVCGVDTKSRLLEARAALAYYEHEFRRRNSGAQVASKKYLGVPYSIWELERNPPVCHAFLNSMLIVTMGEEEMQDVIARFKGRAPANTRSLAASEHYQNVLHHLPAGQ